MYPSEKSIFEARHERGMREAEQNIRANQARMDEVMRQWDDGKKAFQDRYQASLKEEKQQEYQRKMMQDQFERQMQQMRAQHEHELKMRQMELDAMRRPNGQ